MADRIAKDAFSQRSEHEEVISKPDDNLFFLWKENRKIDFSARSFLRKLNSEKRNTEVEQKSSRFKELQSHLEPIEYKEWITMMKSMHSFLNTNFDREKSIRFLMKIIGNILPTADMLKSWKLITDDLCIKCLVTESREHVLGAYCRKELLSEKITQGSRKWLSNAGLLEEERKFVVKFLIRNWNCYSAMGIINIEILEYLNFKNCKPKQIINFGKRCLKIGIFIWKTRCFERMNLRFGDKLDIPNT